MNEQQTDVAADPDQQGANTLVPQQRVVRRPNRLENKISRAHQILDDADEKHSPVHVYACFSGGHDSLVSTHVCMQHFPNAQVLHVNTGIGVPRTRRFVRATCARYGWPLLEIGPQDHTGQSYEEWVMENGFPGASAHRYMYINLKERAIEEALRRAKEGESRMSRVLFVSGVRAAESDRRAGYDAVEKKVKAQVWVSPLYEWNAWDCRAYRERHDLPVNEVTHVLGMSGECLCGAYAKPGELARVRKVCPATADYIEKLQERVRKAGFPWKWEHPGPPRRWRLEREGQLNAFRPLCHGCEKAA